MEGHEQPPTVRRVGVVVNVLMLSVLLALLATLAALTLATKPASAHYNESWFDCVANGVCHYTTVTAYDGAQSYGVKEWNQLSDGTPKHYAYVGSR